MSCTTCGDTLYGVGTAAVWHCPRCGTLLMASGDHMDIFVPKLVKRCREFERIIPTIIVGPAWDSEWRGLGIAESINLPGERPS